MMKAAKTMPQPPWMTASQTVSVMAALNESHAAPKALFVGGCVRNTLLGQDIGEIDIATCYTPAQVIERLGAENIKVIPTGIDHGTVTAVLDDQMFEITTLRRDVKTDGRHAEIEYSEDWAEDAARRDFTMNTLLADSDGNIYDPTGAGLADLDAGRVVFVGAPAQRIEEDYLRILRFFRFYAYYGRGAADTAALTACAAAADHIGSLSRERITQEFLKIMAADNAAAVTGLMFENKILHDLADEYYNPAVLQKLAALQAEHDAADTITRLAVLNRRLVNMESRLVFSNAQKKAFETLFRALGDIADVQDKTVRALIYKYGADRAGQALLLRAAQKGEAADLELVKSWSPPPFPLDGDDVMAAGISSGPGVGAVLDRIEQWWLDHDMQPGREECLKQILN